ncbi:MAG: glycine zipper domain-containing protein [Planctomycetota bacterium]
MRHFRSVLSSTMFYLVLVTFVCSFNTSSTFAQYNQQRGTVVGGLAGAAAGAIIGENSDEPGVGAAIGGLVGAVAGKVLGNVQDQQAYQYQAARQQQAAYYQSRTMTIEDVVAMTQSRVSQPIIASEIQSRGLARPLEIRDIVFLSQQGVSDQVIRTMQQASVGRPAPTPVPVYTPAPRVVTPPVIVTRPPTVFVPGPPVRYGHVRGPRPGRGPYYSGRRPGVSASIYLR